MSDRVVRLLHASRNTAQCAAASRRRITTDDSIMDQANCARAARVGPVTYEPLPEAMTRSLLVDPHDETLETEITEEMVSLALEAMESQLVWPYAGDRAVRARAPRTAEIIRFPGC